MEDGAREAAPSGRGGRSRTSSAPVLLWSFRTIAQPGDPNFEGAWLDDGWDGGRAGVNHWGWYLTVDEEREIVYMSLGSSAGNFWGGDRPGNNLYANSVVAVVAATGRYPWQSPGRSGRPQEPGLGLRRRGALQEHEGVARHVDHEAEDTETQRSNGPYWPHSMAPESRCVEKSRCPGV